MSRGLSAQITGVGLWTPGYGNVEAWRTGASDPEVTKAKAKILDRQCSRRASPFGKAMAFAFEQAVGQAGIDVAQVATVFGSALGETHVMIKLLHQMREPEEDFSPMLFAISVHNAASGLVSISTKNRAFTTSVASDYDTPAMGLMEAIGASRDLGVPAVLVCGDEASPEGLVPEDQTFETLAGAVVVEADSSERPGLARITDLSLDPVLAAAAEIPARLARNPQVGLLDLIDAVVHRRWGATRLDRGEGAGWTARVCEPP